MEKARRHIKPILFEEFLYIIVDVSIVWSISTSVLLKITWSANYPKFMYYFSLKYKTSVINSLIDRAILLSNTEFYNESMIKYHTT